MYPQQEHISRVSFLVCLSVFACTHVHSNSLTTSTDSLACIAGALTKQLSVLPLSKHVSHTCLTLSSNTCVFHTGMMWPSGERLLLPCVVRGPLCLLGRHAVVGAGAFGAFHSEAGARSAAGATWHRSQQQFGAAFLRQGILIHACSEPVVTSDCSHLWSTVLPIDNPEERSWRFIVSDLRGFSIEFMDKAGIAVVRQAPGQPRASTLPVTVPARRWDTGGPP